MLMRAIEGGVEGGRRSPEARLWEAVLLRYCRDLSRPRFAEVARAWVVEEADDVGGFAWVCALLGLDSSAVRQALARGCDLGSLDGTRPFAVHRLKLLSAPASGRSMRVVDARVSHQRRSA